MVFGQYQQYLGANQPTDNYKDYTDLYSTIQAGGAAQGALLQQGAEQLFGARAQGLTAGFQQAQQSLSQSLQSRGVDPGFAMGMMEQQRGMLPQQISTARGETQAQLAQQQAGIIGQQTQETVGLGYAEKQQTLARWLAKKQRKFAKRSQLLSTVGGLGSLAIGGLSLLGGAGAAGGSPGGYGEGVGLYRSPFGGDTGGYGGGWFGNYSSPFDTHP